MLSYCRPLTVADCFYKQGISRHIYYQSNNFEAKAEGCGFSGISIFLGISFWASKILMCSYSLFSYSRFCMLYVLSIFGI